MTYKNGLTFICLRIILVFRGYNILKDYMNVEVREDKDEQFS